MVIFHSYVSLPEGNSIQVTLQKFRGSMPSNWWLLQSRSKRPGAKHSWGIAVELHGFPGNDPLQLRIFYIHTSQVYWWVIKKKSILSCECLRIVDSLSEVFLHFAAKHTAGSSLWGCFWCKMSLPRFFHGDPKPRWVIYMITRWLI